MYSGKSTELLRRLNISKSMGLKVLYINHSFDNRTTNEFSTHNNLIKKNIGISMIKIENLNNIDIDINNYDVIGIDEAQFFDNLYVIVGKWVDNKNKRVIISGLNGDFNRNRFGQILDLIPLCDTIDKLNPYCTNCWKNKRIIKNALFTRKKNNSSNIIEVGAKNIYDVVCRNCYLNIQFLNTII